MLQFFAIIREGIPLIRTLILEFPRNLRSPLAPTVSIGALRSTSAAFPDLLLISEAAL
jgi:hypothetical protein